MANISKITALDGTTYDIKDATARLGLYYGVSDTAAATGAKTVTISGITALTTGLMIAVKFTNANTADSPTLNVNSLGAKNIKQYGATNAAGKSDTTGWQAGHVVILVYDGNYWQFVKGYNTNNTYTLTEVFCGTAAAIAAKVSSNATYYVLEAGNCFECTFRYDNTAKSALTLNINSTGAKPIYINGTASSSSNYTLPAGKYLVYYDGTAYQIRTDGLIPISISGDAATVNGHSVNIDVPANAKLTDTTYESKTAASGGTAVSLVTTGEKYTWNNKGNGTITGIKMNGTSKGTSGVVDLGTVLTAHQDISGKADKSATVSNVAYDSTNKKITKTINGSTTDVVTAATLKTAMALNNVDNTADANKNVLSSTKLANARYLDGVSFDGSADIVHYGVCETAASTAAKTVTITGFDLKVGAIIYVKFTNNNTAISPTLNVNSTGAKPIYSYGQSLVFTDDYTYGWFADDVLPFVYDGTSWVRPHAYNSHRRISVNNEEILGNSGTPLNLINGSNISLDYLDGAVTIAATDTNTHRPIQINGSEILGNTTTALNLKEGNFINIEHGTSGNVTIGLNDYSFITSQSFTASSALTVNANSNATATINVAKSGYTPLGILGITKTGTQNTTCFLVSYSISGNTASIIWRNVASSTNASITTTVTVLFVKS